MMVCMYEGHDETLKVNFKVPYDFRIQEAMLRSMQADGVCCK